MTKRPPRYIILGMSKDAFIKLSGETVTGRYSEPGGKPSVFFNRSDGRYYLTFGPDFMRLVKRGESEYEMFFREGETSSVKINALGAALDSLDMTTHKLVLSRGESFITVKAEYSFTGEENKRTVSIECLIAD